MTGPKRPIPERYMRIARRVFNGESKYRALLAEGYSRSSCRKSWSLLLQQSPSLRLAIQVEYDWRLKNLPLARQAPLHAAFRRTLVAPFLKRPSRNGMNVSCQSCGRNVSRVYLSPDGMSHICSHCAGI
jgi:DNA-directed RNA polymerase subunit N (RpoN/RPB10)